MRILQRASPTLGRSTGLYPTRFTASCHCREVSLIVLLHRTAGLCGLTEEYCAVGLLHVDVIARRYRKSDVHFRRTSWKLRISIAVRFSVTMLFMLRVVVILLVVMMFMVNVTRSQTPTIKKGCFQNWNNDGSVHYRLQFYVAFFDLQYSHFIKWTKFVVLCVNVDHSHG